MKTFGIIGIILVALYIIGKSRGGAGGTQVPAVLGFDAVLNNHNNVHGFDIGQASEFEDSFKQYISLDQASLEKVLAEDALSLYQASNALLVLANIHLKEKDVEKGLPLLAASARVYHNPLAMVSLARAYFHGFEQKNENGEMVFSRDLKKAYYLIHRAFETAGFIHKHTGQKFALDKSVGMGLGLMDSFQLHEVKERFNPRDHEGAIAQDIQKDIQAFAAMYAIR